MSSLIDMFEVGDILAVKGPDGGVSVWKVNSNGGFTLVSAGSAVSAGPA